MFVVDRVAVEQDFLEILWSTPVSTIPPMLRTHPFISHRHCKIMAELNITLHNIGAGLENIALGQAV